MNATRNCLLSARICITAHVLTLIFVCGLFSSGVQRELVAAVQTETPSKNPSASEQEKSLTEPQLVEGLLELIEKQDTTPSAPQDPLVPVRKMMLEVSELLQGGQTIHQAADLQVSILDQLDALISQLQGDQSSPPTNRDASSGSQPDQDLAQQPGSDFEAARSNVEDGNANEIRQDRTGQSDTGEIADPQSLSEKQSRNGQSDKAGAEATNTPVASHPGASSTEKSDTPAELQESVWGHLPEKLRSQMQSRMVEQFLPSYRKQLESYYRTLLMQESDR